MLLMESSLLVALKTPKLMKSERKMSERTLYGEKSLAFLWHFKSQSFQRGNRACTLCFAWY